MILVMIQVPPAHIHASVLTHADMSVDDKYIYVREDMCACGCFHSYGSFLEL